MTKTRDIVSGIALVLLSAFLYYNTLGGGIILFEDDIDPMIYPRVISVMLGCLGAIIAISAALRQHWPPSKDIRIFTPRTIGISLVLVVYAAVFTYVGFAISSVAAGCSIAWIMGWRKPVSLLLVNCLATGLIWLLFVKGLRIILPAGKLFG